MNTNARLTEQLKFVQAFGPDVPGAVAGPWVSLKHYERFTILITVLNAAVPLPGTFGLLQATDIAAAGSKVLSLTKVWSNIDTAADDALTEEAVAADAFTPDVGAGKGLMYVIEGRATDLDVNGNFDCINVSVGVGAAITMSITYVLWPARYSNMPSALVD